MAREESDHSECKDKREFIRSSAFKIIIYFSTSRNLDKNCTI